MARDESAIGTVGVLIVATRGQAGPGEVLDQDSRRIRELPGLVAKPLPKGTTVLVIEYLGPRTVDVMEWDDPLGEAPAIPGSTEVPRSGE